MKRDSRSGLNLLLSKVGAIINRTKLKVPRCQRGTRLHLAGQRLNSGFGCDESQKLAMGRDDLKKSDWTVLLVCSRVIQMESRK